MVKKLRSRILEQIPFDLRVAIELLSRRRDISNAEKQEELFKLLRQYNINDIVPLGSGTNRYAFKLNGFVIKVATDHDGKIDNLKEFKMAKRLYPHVIKVYEVSENGTLEVCEYIQPFQSYGEMALYAGQIKEILKELSSVYLIGDVGITAKNFSNWGLRIGGDRPVCLDFAYVYEVTSALFICPYCKTNTMIVPNEEFTSLYCPYSGCGHKFTFEDIRAKLGNDIHRHEIGDLSDEGYRLTESNVDVELTESRSNYLAKKKKVEEVKPVDTEKEVETPDTFYIPENVVDKEDNIMSDKIIMATASIVDMDAVKAANNIIAVVTTPKAQVPNVDTDNIVGAIDDTEEQNTDNNVSLAFTEPVDAFLSADSDDEKAESEEPDDEEPDDEDEESEELDDNTSTALDVVMNEIAKDAATDKAPVSTPTAKAPKEVVAKAKVVQEAPVEKPKYTKPEKRHSDSESKYNSNKPERGTPENLAAAVSAICTRIGKKWCNEVELYNAIEADVKTNKLNTVADVYKGVQNAVYHTLVDLLKFEKTVEPREDGDGTRTIFRPTSLTGDFEPTLVFIDRFYNDPEVWKGDYASVVESLNAYRKKYPDHLGFQPEFAKMLRSRVKTKCFAVKETGHSIICTAIIDAWVTSETSDEPKKNPHPPKPEIIGKNPKMEETKDDEEIIDSSDAIDGDFEANDDGELNSNSALTVTIHLDDGFDCIRLSSADIYGPINIPFYTNWKTAEPVDTFDPVDPRNGVWDWLAYMVPDIRFYSKNPERWVQYNDTDPDNHMKFCILDAENEKDDAIVGIFEVNAIVIDNGDGTESVADDEILNKLNLFLSDELSTMLTHLRRSLSMNMDEILSERHMEECIKEYNNDNPDDEEPDDEDEESEELDDNTSTALGVVMNNAEPEEEMSAPDTTDDEVEDITTEAPATFKPIRRK